MTRRWLLAGFLILAAAAPQAQTPVAAQADTPATLSMASAVSALNLSDLVRAGLASSQPEMRMTAARISAVRGMVPMVPDLARAIDAEPHMPAAVAEMQALLVIGTPDARAAADSFARKATGDVLGVYALWLARSSPDAFADRLPEFLKQSGAHTPARFSVALDHAVTQRPELKARLATPWMAGAPRRWDDMLEHLRPEADATTLTAALASPETRVREETIWHLLGHRAAGATLPPGLRAAAMPGPAGTAGASSELTWEGFAREVMARVDGGAPAMDRAEWLRTRAVVRQRELRHVWWIDDALTRRERAAIEAAVSENVPNFPGPRPIVPPAPFGDAAPPPEPSVMRTMPTLFPGFVPAVMTATGCKVTPRDHAQVAVRLTYHASGRPVSASIDRTVSPECQRALRAFIQVTLADDTLPAAGPDGEWLVLFTGGDYRQCADAPVESRTDSDRDERDAVVLERGIARPKIVRKVDPVYPASAKDARIAGMVMIEATISAQGCVRDARVTRSVRPALDLSALTAVTQWRYTPTLVQGRPVEVIMSVNVTYAIH
jgi:TonB family protein